MRKLPSFITQEEFNKLLDATKDREKKLALLLGFEAGMRISEIVGLKNQLSKCCNSEIEEYKECLKDNPKKHILEQFIKDSIEVLQERIENLQKCRKNKQEVMK